MASGVPGRLNSGAIQWKGTSVSAKKMVAVLCSTLMMGCAVGPNFKRPEAPAIQSYTSAPLTEQTVATQVQGGSAQELLLGKKIPEQWWTLFHSPALDRLIRQGLAANPSVASAQAALRQARENLNAEFGNGLMPSVDARLSAGREQISGASFGQATGNGSTFSLYDASVSVSYLLDIFGGVRRQLEALRAEVDYQHFQAVGTYLTLTANIVTTAVREASLRAQLKATQEIISDQQEAYRLVQRQFELGSIARSDVLSQQTQLAQTRATLPPLENSLHQTRHQLAVLVGRFPSQAADLPQFDFDTLTLPTKLPVSVPSDLVRQRPDIQAASALLHAASAQVGVATANLYPQITLSGAYGWRANQIGDLFSGDALIWNFGAGLLQPIFHGGALRAQKRAAVAAFDQALAVYKQTVLQGFLNVADALRALEADALLLKDQAEVESAARETLRLSKIQFNVGATSYLTLLDAQRQYQQARINLVRAQAARFSDTAALFQALGGGWWYPVPAEGPMTEQTSMKGNHD
jgi:NodT family efflux transporter outer membrane factor (OMF) lipoprotein